MNSSIYGIKSDQNLRKSFIIQSYHSQVLPGSQNTPSLIKRSSFNQNQNYPPLLENSKTPKTVPFQMEGLQVSNQYYHQSNYANNSYKPQQYQPPLNTSVNRIESTSTEDKKIKQHQIEDTIKQLTQKLQKTMIQVQKHQISLKNIQNTPNMPQLYHQSLAKIITETVNDRVKAQQIQTNMHFNNCKTQIQQLKAEIRKYVQVAEVQDRIKKIGHTINKAIQQVRSGLITHLSQMSENLTKARKKQIQKIKIHFEEQIANLEKNFGQKLKKEKDDWDKLTECSSMDTISSKKYFIGDPLLVRFATKVAINLKGIAREVEEAETVYKLDNQGYLLDSEGRYILNSKYQQVKLSSQQLQLIREKGFLK